MNTKSAMKASIVMLAVPFSLIGAVWLMYMLGLQYLHRLLGGDDRTHGA